MKYRLLLCIFSTLFTLDVLANIEDTPFLQRKDVQEFIRNVVKQYHLNRSEVEHTLSQVKIEKPVITSIKHPKEKKPWTDYQKLFLTQQRIEEGVRFWNTHHQALARAEKKYGVPAKLVVAILGVETHYGQRQGTYRVLDSLATLSFNFKARARFFKKELANFLVLCHEQGFNPTTVLGSYAGAIGQPQFMPSSYRHYAVDFSNDGKIDLRNNTTDAIGSIANYFSKHGWQPNQGVVEPAILEGKTYTKLITNAKYAKHRINQLQRHGIKNSPGDGIKRASLMALKSKSSQEYWLGYPNFFVITRYNTSKQYALAVYQLAEAIETAKKPHP